MLCYLLHTCLTFCVSPCRKTNFLIVLSNIVSKSNSTDLHMHVWKKIVSNVLNVISVFQNFHGFAISDSFEALPCTSYYCEYYLLSLLIIVNLVSFICKLTAQTKYDTFRKRLLVDKLITKERTVYICQATF